MKLMKNWIKTMLFVSALCLAACSDDPDVAPLKRDTDAVELTYNSGATTQIGTLCRFVVGACRVYGRKRGSGEQLVLRLSGQWCR